MQATKAGGAAEGPRPEKRTIDAQEEARLDLFLSRYVGVENSRPSLPAGSRMVLRQPPLAQDEWTSEIDKMRNASCCRWRSVFNPPPTRRPFTEG
jgi:hypothetical protein